MNHFFAGAKRAAGVVAGFLPIAMSFGAIAVQSGVTSLATIAMSVWIFAGASQFAVIEAINQGLPWLSIVLTVLIINLRHMPMSLSIQRIYGGFSKPQQWVLSHGLVDETFALEMTEAPQPFLYYLGMHLTCWASWVIGTVIGTQFGLLIPQHWLAFALPSLFLCLLVNGVRDAWTRSTAIATGVGIALVLLTRSLGATGILISILGVVLAISLASNSRPPLKQEPNP